MEPDLTQRVSPRRRFGSGALVLVALAAASIGGAVALGFGRGSTHPEQAAHTEHAERWTCPMHPSVVREHVGDCPICGMTLVAVDAHAPTGRVGPEGGGTTWSGIAGRGTVDIDPARQQLIGLTTAKVTRGRVEGAWRTVGRVATDETRIRHVNVKVPGFVERIAVDSLGRSVRRGDVLFALYSPELLAAQEEYLLALRTRAALGEERALASDGEALVEAARRKLLLWDVPASEIERVARTGKASRTLAFVSPASGVVTKKDVVEGMRLEAGAMPYEIVDLSEVWVLADVYETDLRHVRVGTPATLTLAALPDREFHGSVLFVDPVLDPQTRTVKVRLAFSNRAGDLRPGMFGEVVLRGPAREGLRIPLDAIIDSGTDRTVFVALGGGKFEPRRVTVGAVDGSAVEVRSGLSEGEAVVTRANFLVDSESRLRASLAELAGSASRIPESARVLPPRGEEISIPVAGPPAGTTPRAPPVPPATPAAPPTGHAGHSGHAP